MVTVSYVPRPVYIRQLSITRAGALPRPLTPTEV